MLELKPCPFCGCEMVLKPTLMCDKKTIRYEPTAKASVNHGGLYGNHKRGCALDYVAFIGYPTTVKRAREKWNRRVESEGAE